jgi:hypothetical protein
MRVFYTRSGLTTTREMMSLATFEVTANATPLVSWFKEKTRLEFRAEAFNVSNELVLGPAAVSCNTRSAVF